jgi:hypothetical protein
MDRVTLAERFWQLAPPTEDESGPREPLQVVRHLIAILHRFRDLERARDRDKTVATLSLLTMVRQQEALGDVNYASPEQLRDEELTERSLVFSVGVLLFERLCERHPFSADEGPLRLIRQKRAELGSGVNYFPFVPNGLRAVLQSALSSRPEDRPQTLEALADELLLFMHPKARPQRRPARAPLPPGLAAISVGEHIGLLLTTPSEREDATEREIRFTAEPATEDEALPAPPKRRAVRWPIAAVATAAGASLVVALLWSQLSPRESPPAAVVAVAPVAAPTMVAPEPAVAAAPAAAGPATVAAPAPAAGTAQAAAAAVEAAGVAKPAFDPEAGGRAAIAPLQECFSPYDRTRGATFGLSMLFHPETGRSSKVYFPSEPELDEAHLACLSRVLRGISAGAAPSDYVSVEYRFVVKSDAVQVTVLATNP